MTTYKRTEETRQYANEMVNLDENIKAVEDAVNSDLYGDCRKAGWVQVGRLKAANELLRQAAAMLRGEANHSY